MKSILTIKESLLQYNRYKIINAGLVISRSTERKLPLKCR